MSVSVAGNSERISHSDMMRSENDMKYLLDSDAVSILYDDTRKAHHKAIHGKIGHLGDEDILQTSVLVLCELEYSFFNAPPDKRIRIRNTIDSLIFSLFTKRFRPKSFLTFTSLSASGKSNPTGHP